MKHKSEILRHLEEAIHLLKRQSLPSDELKVRTFVTMALKQLAEAVDDDRAQSGAV